MVACSTVTRYSHASEAVKTDMGFAVFTPEAAQSTKLPVLYWLSGLTCDDTNFIFKVSAAHFVLSTLRANLATDLCWPCEMTPIASQGWLLVKTEAACANLSEKKGVRENGKHLSVAACGGAGTRVCVNGAVI